MMRAVAQGTVWLLSIGFSLPLVVGCSSDTSSVGQSSAESAGRTVRSTAGQPEDLLGEPIDPSELKTLSDQLLALWGWDIEMYREHSKDPPHIRPLAEEFIRTVQLGMLPRPRGPGYGQTVEMGKRLLEQGCEDPLVKAYYGEAVCAYQGDYPALRLFVDAANAVQPSVYPAEYRLRTTFLLFSRAKPYCQMLSKWPRLRKEVASFVRQRLHDKRIPAEMRRALFFEFARLMTGGQSCGRYWEDGMAIYEACKNVPDVDPWLLHMVAGVAYCDKAWHHRGGDWAYTVTPERWELFFENLKQAAEHFTAAWELRPDCPEAAHRMIGVAMARGCEQSPQEWFEKAVSAQFDYMPAYYSLLWALRPRWGGSHEAMYRFGCRCAETRRYDTRVPFVLIDALDDIDEELNRSYEIWSREGAYERVKEVLEAMAAEPVYADEGGYYPHHRSLKTIQMALAARAGRWDEARRLADELGDRLDRWILRRWQPHPEGIVANIYAWSGKAAPYLDEAWNVINEAPKPVADEVLKKAIALFRKALEADPHEYSQAYCQSMLDTFEGRLAFAEGKWFERTFDPKLLAWRLIEGDWTRESENTVFGSPYRGAGRVWISPWLCLFYPYELEFDIELIDPPPYPVTVGLFIPVEGSSGISDDSGYRFFIRTRENVVGIELPDDSKTVPYEPRSVNHFRLQIAPGRVFMYVNGEISVDYQGEDFRPASDLYFGSYKRLYHGMAIRLSNVRMRKWKPPAESPPAEKTSQQHVNSEPEP